MIAVTTRSRAKSLRHVAPMLLGTKLVERDLETATGCDRYVSVVTGPKEVWTLSIWRDPRETRAFMRTRAHARIMWAQPDLLECYWGMRWRPGSVHGGTWEGGDWSFPPARHEDDPPAGAPLPVWMQAALGRTVRVERRALAGAVGATYRLKAPPWRLAGAARDLRRVRCAARNDPDTLTASLDPIAAAEARRTIRAALDGRDGEGLHTVALLVTELVANSIRHTGLPADDRIGLQVRGRDDWIRVDVIDRGGPFEPHVPTGNDLDAQSGRGLSFVDQMAERWGISRPAGDRHFWFELRVPYAGAATSSAPTRP